jgi:DNA-directed RNA polymerase subunit F
LSHLLRWPIFTTLCLTLAISLPLYSLAAEDEDEKKNESSFDVSEFESFQGFINSYWDSKKGKIWIQIPDPNLEEQSFLYISSLATGLGSNPVGLDRGQLSSERIVHFRSVGERAFLVQENWKYRASTDNLAERRAIRDSFAESILWGGKVERDAAGMAYVDMTDFFLRDAHDCVGTLASSGQGNFSLDKNRSHIYLPRCKSFPDNSEIEAALTFSSSKPGRLARRVAADGKSITLRQHHSFVRLPDAGYRPRAWDPRVGCFSVDFADYGAPIEDSIEKRLIARHRLEKLDPSLEKSPAKDPIVYYVDPGVPQPVRDALIEGASWWNEAFESAGFVDAFQVKVLPEDADPMDVRYNVIQWVHRATRGWSYGQSVTDPRTGEIIKGHVLLGSLRVRQDHLIFEGLGQEVVASGSVRANQCGMGSVPDEAYLSQLDPNLSSTEVALARIRQLSAHEVGHTIGFAHNFAASTYADRASVMDYPAPRVKIVDGRLDLSDAYGVGIGEWDKFSVQYAYSEFKPEEEPNRLAALIASAQQRGLRYISDADARPAGAAHPLANLWDDGTDPVTALQHEMQVRRIAIDTFDASAIRNGDPYAELEKAFVPVYLHHRYQVEAAAKALAGYNYTYAVRDEKKPVTAVQTPIDLPTQLAALVALGQTIQPEELVIPQRILALIPPRVSSSASDRERFSSQTGPIFDANAAMESAAELTIGCLLQPERASRLAKQGADADQLGLRTVITALRNATLDGAFERIEKQQDTYTREELIEFDQARRIVERVFVHKLLELCSNPRASLDARYIAIREANEIQRELMSKVRDYTAKSPVTAQWLALIADIQRFLDRPYPSKQFEKPVELPPGSPIGS